LTQDELRTFEGKSQLKKSYYELARKVHPDKNKAPGAAEAFKKLEESYKTLEIAWDKMDFSLIKINSTPQEGQSINEPDKNPLFPKNYKDLPEEMRPVNYRGE